MKLIRTEDAVGHVLCHDMTQIIKDAYKDARFRKGDKLAGMRVIPLIIEEEKLRRAEEAAGDEPLLQLLPFVKKTACIVTTGSEVKKGLIQDTFTPVVVEKLQAYGIETIATVQSGDGVENVRDAVLAMREKRADITAFGEGGLCLGCGQCHTPSVPSASEPAMRPARAHHLENRYPYVRITLR